MSVYINKDKISKVYFGGDNIVKIYKGRDLVFGDDGGGGDGQLELTFASAVSSGDKLLQYNGRTYYKATKDYTVGDVLVINDLPSLTSLSFSGYYTYASIKVLPKLDTSKVTNMGSIFINLVYLTNLDVSNLDTSNVTRMDFMFCNCSSLTSLDVRNLNTSNVTDMYGMFCYCSSLTSLDVTNFDTSKVTSMRAMFDSCSKLTNLNVSNFDTTNVTEMRYMFDNCPVLSNIIFGEGWGKSSTSGLTLDLSTCNADNKYQFTDETWNSLLTLYDRATNGLPTMTIKIKSSSNFPSGWVSKMTAKGYTISYG